VLFIIILTDLERFNFLNTKLFCEVKFAIIAGLALSNENYKVYKVAVDIVLKRCGNPQEIIDVHYNELISNLLRS
jgi:hypothetical protein